MYGVPLILDACACRACIWGIVLTFLQIHSWIAVCESARNSLQTPYGYDWCDGVPM